MPLWAGFAATPGAGTVPHGRQDDRTTWDSVFSAAQAGRGETTYTQRCARCHMETLAGGDEAGELTGSAFMSSWNGQTLADLHERIRTTMPTDTPGVYSSQQITDVIAYMLRFNGFPPGSVELTHTNDALKSIRFVTAKP
jgi:mono/diheme cytochrome c family protein